MFAFVGHIEGTGLIGQRLWYVAELYVVPEVVSAGEVGAGSFSVNAVLAAFRREQMHGHEIWFDG